MAWGCVVVGSVTSALFRNSFLILYHVYAWSMVEEYLFFGMFIVLCDG